MQDCFNCKIIYTHIYVYIGYIYFSNFGGNFVACKTRNSQFSALGVGWNG
jgi:hypothetical protein